jgi:hypothetical protein
MLETLSLCVGDAYYGANYNSKCKVVDCGAKYQTQRNSDSYRLPVCRIHLHALPLRIAPQINSGDPETERRRLKATGFAGRYQSDSPLKPKRFPL